MYRLLRIQKRFTVMRAFVLVLFRGGWDEEGVVIPCTV